MSWTQPGDLKARLQRRWDRGELLAAVIEGGGTFPLALPLKGPSSTEMASRFEEVRAWVAALRAMPHARLEMRTFSHRVLGTNAIPRLAWIDQLDGALALIGKQREARRFRELLDQTRQRQPALLEWLAKRPLQALELADAWGRLLDVLAWMLDHPRPGIYLRQVDIPGVHSKFIETHRRVLGEWLDHVLPPAAIDASQIGASRFAARYGFRDKPARIRFRFLDPFIDPFIHPGVDALPGPLPGRAPGFPPAIAQADITLDADSFAALDPPVRRVVITENEINFLALPPLARSLALFGAGYGWEALAKAQWLHDRDIHYWGDIDSHGFVILDQLRRHFPQVRSLLMDRATLLTHEDFWGQEANPARQDLPRLTATEAALYDELRDNRLRPSLRLEQEHLGFGWVQATLGRLG